MHLLHPPQIFVNSLHSTLQIFPCVHKSSSWTSYLLGILTSTLRVVLEVNMVPVSQKRKQTQAILCVHTHKLTKLDCIAHILWYSRLLWTSFCDGITPGPTNVFFCCWFLILTGGHA